MAGATSHRLTIIATLLAAVMPALVFVAAGPADPAGAAVTQPKQPKTGPGGSHYTHDGVRESSGGVDSDAWFVFEPTKPRPKKAPVAILMHGYYEYAGHDQLDAMIQHTVKKGSIVIYPRWQTGVATPCPGPIAIEPCVEAATTAIRDALSYLRSSPKHVQPETGKASYFGFSFGGILTANLTNRYRELRLPEPRAIFFEDPHDGGLVGLDEPALDDSLAGIPSTTLVQCHASADGVTGESGKENSGCNSLYPKLTSIPKKNRDLVLTSVDDHGSPALAAPHGVCAGGSVFAVDAYDWGFCWKAWDALRSCALKKRLCDFALGNTRRHRYIGTWSDGSPIIGLKVREVAPIRALPLAPRIPNPDRR